MLLDNFGKILSVLLVTSASVSIASYGTVNGGTVNITSASVGFDLSETLSLSDDSGLGKNIIKIGVGNVS